MASEKKVICKHPAYIVKDGALVCSVCGEPSPKAQVVYGQVVKTPSVITCPHCGGKFDEGGNKIEDKALKKEVKTK